MISGMSYKMKIKIKAINKFKVHQKNQEIISMRAVLKREH